MRSNSNLPGRLASEETSLSYQIIYYKDPSESELTIKGAKGLERGEEALSAPYCYDVLVETTSTDAEDYRAWLGRRVEFQSMCNGKVLQAVGGIVTSVFSGPVELYEDSSTGWFKLRIEPEFVTACYSRNRKVYNGSKEDVLTTIAGCWNTVCKVTDKAKARIPSYLQLVQNDESDYNFFCRLLAAWGLGYYWTMEATPENGNAGGDDETIVKETLNVFSVLDGEIQGSAAALACMSSRDGNLPSWSLHTGFHSLGSGKMDVQDYLHGSVSEPVLSVPDASWDQLTSDPVPGSPNYSIHHFLSNHFNANSVHGLYRYVSSESESKAATVDQVAALKLGDMVTWADGASYDKAGYFLTKRVVSGGSDSWSVELTGRASVKVDTMDVGCGVLPRPLYPASDPDLNEDAPLLQAAPWESPKPRTFMAVVTSVTVLDSQGRNFCKVREITGQEMWVEMGSPSADSRSGIFARPRVGNVLFCMDRGDFSIPIAISAMFRSSSSVATNETPLTKLKVMDRHTREMKDARVNDNSALTLRSRAHVPGRKTAEHDKTISDDDLTFVQRPQSVSDLAKHPKPFSQIQMFSRDNGVKPIQQDPSLVTSCNADAIAETAIGFATETDYSAGFPGCSMAEGIQNESNTPISRPHLQGISTYSSGDLITQSADHQIMNAGGEIVLTAAQAITLRVGRSYVRISEYGVDIGSDIGDVERTGAYPAYHTTDDAEKNECTNGDGAPLVGGHITVDAVGVYNKGVYISNTAVNMFAANTILGSSFTLSDFGSRLFAPAVNIIGGAALESTLLSGCKEAIFSGTANAGLTSDNPVYTGPLEDGYKKKGYHKANEINCGLGAVCSGLGAIGSIVGAVKGKGEKYTNLFSLTGSMIKMLPERMVLSSAGRFDYYTTNAKVSSASSGFIATAENFSFGTTKLGAGVHFGLGRTVATLTGAWINACGSGSGYNSTEQDTFTGNEGDQTVIPGAYDGLDGKDGAAIASVVVGTIAGIVFSFCNPVEPLANAIFGKRKDEAIGIESEEVLTKAVTAADSSTALTAHQEAISTLAASRGIANTAAEAVTQLRERQDVSVGELQQAIATRDTCIANYQEKLSKATSLIATATTQSSLRNKTITMSISN